MDGHSDLDSVINLHKKSVFIQCYIPKQSLNPQIYDSTEEIVMWRVMWSLVIIDEDDENFM